MKLFDCVIPSVNVKVLVDCDENCPSPTPNAHFPFWDDLYFQEGETHSIFYQYEGTAPNRSLTFEWYGTKYSAKGTYFAHFLVSFYEALPSWTTYA
jgi:hypothetical protein